MIPYGHPATAFEDYYASRQMAYAAGHMPNVRRDENMQVLSISGGDPAPCHRVAQMSDDSVADLRARNHLRRLAGSPSPTSPAPQPVAQPC